jgi:hypothetical protein
LLIRSNSSRKLSSRSPRTRCGISRLQLLAVRSQLPLEPVCPPGKRYRVRDDLSDTHLCWVVVKIGGMDSPLWPANWDQPRGGSLSQFAAARLSSQPTPIAVGQCSRKLFGREIGYDCSMRIRCRISGRRRREIRIARVADLVIGISLLCLAPVFGQEYMVSTLAGGSPPPTPLSRHSRPTSAPVR